MNLPAHLSAKERQALEQAVQKISEMFAAQVRFIALFGSKARGDFGPDSDIDVLIISESDDWRVRQDIRDPIYDADLEYSTFTSSWVIAWERFQTLPRRRPGLFANLRRDAIELWRRPGTENPLTVPEPAVPVA